MRNGRDIGSAVLGLRRRELHLIVVSIEQQCWPITNPARFFSRIGQEMSSAMMRPSR
jgi:hypothetical protein